MCTTVTIDGQYVDEHEELEKILGGEAIYEAEAIPGPKVCLCPIDLFATAAKFGYKCEWSKDVGMGDAIMTKIT